MTKIRLNLRRILTITFALACVGLALLWPNWRDELRAQTYSLFGPSVTIDICEVDNTGIVRVGGKVGDDARFGADVFVSRGNQNQIVDSVGGNGTFEGTTAPGFAGTGQKVTVGIRPVGDGDAWIFTCELVSSNRR